jgi:hypothetical protein
MAGAGTGAVNFAVTVPVSFSCLVKPAGLVVEPADLG